MASLWVGLVACSFDSNTDSVGGMSLGDGDSTSTGDGDGSLSTSLSSGSASSATATSATTPVGESTDPASTTNPSTTTDDPTTSPTTAISESETLPPTTTDSATSQGSSGDDTTADPTTGGTEASYPACPGGMDDECPADHVCLTVESGDVIVASWCGEAACDSDDDCPPPSDGDAMPDCRGPNGSQFCTLRCDPVADDCPTDMECQTFWSQSAGAYVDNCVWPVP